ncbi:hypothetical protein [Thermococcus peptonophilus]|uniref:Uncharacterized protein n=1 Tax=Thermococcus peptonophilus TaxID=53952 RepID=A0A142CUU2_9EURY|nr:hypothetical protein [Thermococcus peptonophilus]AMQ18544.1 hypothetical protein A0127_04870 [Thermococcus peptonophilus]
MRAYDPVTVAIPLAYRLEKIMLEKKSLPSGDEVKTILKELGLEELYSGKGLALLRNQDVVVLVFPRESLVIDVIPATGEVSDALEVIAYHDRKLNALILEVLPANDIEYEGNIGVEPAIISLESGELESAPVFGDFREGEDGIYLVIDKDTFQRWKESGKLDVCPICGGGLSWRGKKAICLDCGYGVKVVEE